MRIALPEARRAVPVIPALAVSLALAVFLAYANAFSGIFQFDDYNVIVFNPRVHGWQAWLHSLGSGIRPLLNLSYMLNWTSGLGMAGFHGVNLAIHLGNVWLVYLLSRRFLRAHPALPDHRFGIAFWSAMLFAVHPVHTEAVTYISGRSISLMTLFYLGGLLANAVGYERSSRWLLHLITPLCFVAALAVKETAVTFPLALLAWHLANGGRVKDALRTQWASWLVLAAAAAFFLTHGGYPALVANSARFNSLGGNIATQAGAFLYLLRQWLLPLWLDIDPDLPVAHRLGDMLPQLLLLAGIILLMLASFRRRPWLGLGLAWALLQLVPLYWVLPRADVANDRQLYLASWPLALALASEGALLLRQRRPLVLAGIALTVALGTLTFMRNQDYRSEIALWQSAAALSPHKPRVHNNLGLAYELANRRADARREYEIALRLKPDYRKAQANLERVNE